MSVHISTSIITMSKHRKPQRYRIYSSNQVYKFLYLCLYPSNWLYFQCWTCYLYWIPTYHLLMRNDLHATQCRHCNNLETTHQEMIHYISIDTSRLQTSSFGVTLQYVMNACVQMDISLRYMHNPSINKFCTDSHCASYDLNTYRYSSFNTWIWLSMQSLHWSQIGHALYVVDFTMTGCWQHC